MLSPSTALIGVTVIAVNLGLTLYGVAHRRLGMAFTHLLAAFGVLLALWSVR